MLLSQWSYIACTQCYAASCFQLFGCFHFVFSLTWCSMLEIVRKACQSLRWVSWRVHSKHQSTRKAAVTNLWVGIPILFYYLFSISHKCSSFQVFCSFLQVAGSDGACNEDHGNLALVIQEAGRSAKHRWGQWRIKIGEFKNGLYKCHDSGLGHGQKDNAKNDRVHHHSSAACRANWA